MSTGAAAGVIGDMRRQQRREDARRARRRALRQAKWDGIRAMRDTEGAPERAVTRWPFACASVCGNCGALAVPVANTSGDPMRRDDAPATPARCTKCDASEPTLIDLANRDMATALVDAESHDRQLHAKRFGIIGRPLLQSVLLAALAVGLFMLGPAPVAGTTLAAASVQRGFATAQRVAAQGDAPTHARRWAHHPRPGKAVAQSHGPASGQVRHAPLTGRPCVAYDVRVAWNGESPDTPRSLALQEQATGALHVGRTDVSDAYLALEPRKLSTQDVLRSPRAIEYLASRGLEPGDGAFDYYETLIVEADQVRTTRDAHGRTAVHV